MSADGSVTINYQVGNTAWVSSVTRTNEVLFNAPEPPPPPIYALNRTVAEPIAHSACALVLACMANRMLPSVFTGAGAPAPITFKVTVNPRAVADNLLGVAGTTSTFDVLRNDTMPQSGTSATIVSFTQPTNGMLVAGSVPGTLRYTPTPASRGMIYSPIHRSTTWGRR